MVKPSSSMVSSLQNESKWIKMTHVHHHKRRDSAWLPPGRRSVDLKKPLDSLDMVRSFSERKNPWFPTSFSVVPRLKSPVSPFQGFQGFQGAGSSGDLRLGSEELEKLGNLISRKSQVTDFNKKSRTQTNAWILGSIFLDFWMLT